MSLAPGCHRHSRAAALVVAGALLLAACGPDPTPLPVVPVETAPPAEATEQMAADALTLDRLTFHLLTAEQLDRLERAAEVRVADAVTDALAGPALSVAAFSGAEISDYALPLAFRLNTAVPPLDNPALAGVIGGFLAGETERSALRPALANAGYPDGLVLSYAGSAAIGLARLPLTADGPLRWRAMPESSSADVEFGAGAEAAALLSRGGRLSGSLPLYLSAGWRLTADEDGLPLLERSE